MINGSNNNFQSLRNRISSNSPPNTQGNVPSTPSNKVEQAIASANNIVGSVESLVTGVSSIVNSIAGLFGGLFGRKSSSSGTSAQSVSSPAQASQPANTSKSPQTTAASAFPGLAARLKGQTLATSTSSKPAPTPPVLIPPVSIQPSTASAQASTSQVSALAITPSLMSAANDASPRIDQLLGLFMVLKPALDLFQIKKPSADEIMSTLTEAKVAVAQIAQGQQPTVHGAGVSDFGKETFKFTNDALRIVMTAKGLAQLFNYKDASFQKSIGEAEKALMDVRVFSDILSRSVQ